VGGILPVVERNGDRTSAGLVVFPQVVEATRAQVVPIPDEERTVKKRRHALDPARGAKGLRLERVRDADAPSPAISEILGHGLRKVMQIDGQIRDAMLPQPADAVFQERLAAQAHHAFGHPLGQRPEARPLPRRQHHRLGRHPRPPAGIIRHRR